MLLIGAREGLAAGGSRTPRIKLQADSSAGGAVQLKITVSSARSIRAARVKLLRAADDARLQPYAELLNPRSNQILMDAVSEDGIYSYRAKITGKMRSGPRKGRKISARSRIVAVYVEIPSGTPGNGTPGSNPEDPPPPIELGAGISRCPASFAQNVLDIVNYHRISNGLNPLALHPQLNWAAEKHSDWMIRNNSFVHDGWFDEILQSGFQGSSFGQNIARMFTSPASVMDGWMGSAGHRANILKSSYGHMGLSCLQDSGGGMWWTQDFGS